MEEVSFADFKALDLKIGEIKEVEDLEGYDNLYKLVVDLGEESQRVLLAGVKQWYQKEDLVGLQVVVVANLEPKKIAGMESRGMLLAADLNDRPVLIMPCERVSPGTRVR